ncbi:MAG TPA: DNA-3-methyladenine glycosylase 2, partial [Gemmatimonadales bacterium]|nr:DNA-3-methyladenine glycosylase 2 [Gemmatimonadales bacterium]
TQVAFASGFASLRRFNDAFRRRYGMPPSHLRRAARTPGANPGDQLILQLGYRPPFDWDGLLQFLAPRALRGVEIIADSSYARTVALGGATGTIAVRHAPERRALMLELSHSLLPVLPALLDRVRNLFDLTARPDLINQRFGADPLLAPLAAANPGLRVPGAFDCFEIAMRAILGQQVTVKGASTLAARVVESFGQPIETDRPGLTRLAPTAERLAAAPVDGVASLGIVRTRAVSVVTLAREISGGRLHLQPGVDPAATVRRLTEIPGIGPWTAHYIAMRVLRWPDAFPREDKVLRDALGGISAREAERQAEAWRPWRSYAALHLWRTQ